jgi:hypothetical protein
MHDAAQTHRTAPASVEVLVGVGVPGVPGHDGNGNGHRPAGEFAPLEEPVSER